MKGFRPLKALFITLMTAMSHLPNWGKLTHQWLKKWKIKRTLKPLSPNLTSKTVSASLSLPLKSRQPTHLSKSKSYPNPKRWSKQETRSRWKTSLPTTTSLRGTWNLLRKTKSRLFSTCSTLEVQTSNRFSKMTCLQILWWIFSRSTLTRMRPFSLINTYTSSKS